MKKDIYQIITDKIISAIETGQANGKHYICEFIGANQEPKRHNGVAYNGINAFVLSIIASMNGYKNDFWFTFKQAQDLGGQVRKGEKSAPVIYFSQIEKEDDEGTKEKYSFLRMYNVFNAQQIDNLPEHFYIEKEYKKRDTHQEIEIAEKILKKSQANINHSNVARAYYAPDHDMIHLSYPIQFTNEQAYYRTALHELTHWTGHKTRLSREQNSRFGSVQYAFEELIAELGSAFLMQKLGITSLDTGLDNHENYIASWLEALKNDTKFIFKASSEAQKACDYILATAN